MTVRYGRGAVMGLVVVSALVLVLIGLLVFFLSRQLGGGRELQHAADAGTLNVAKQALKRPGVSLVGSDEINHFGDSIDPNSSEVNLATYNRLVGQALLVALNAQAEGTTQAASNAAALINIVNGIGQRLNNQLVLAENFTTHFEGVAQSHVMRMLGPEGNPALHVTGQHAVAFMARGKASNVFVNPNQIPQGAAPLGAFTIDKGGKSYIKGYESLSIGGQTLWAVPLRPQEEPHLVSLSNFQSESSRNGLPGFLPPNTFKSAAQAKDAKSGMNVIMAASAVVGALNLDFPASIPRGVIIIDNTGSLSGTFVPGGEDIWSNQLMPPNYVEVMGSPCREALVADVGGGAGPLAEAKQFVNDNYDALINGDQNKQNQLKSKLDAAGIDNFPPGLPNTAALSSTEAGINFLRNHSVSNCNNQNTSSGGQPCNAGELQNIFNQGSGSSGGGLQSGLLAVQRFHFGICEIRATGQDSARFTMDGTSGLKQYDRNDCGLDNSVQLGTLNQLLALTAGVNANAIKSQIEVRLHQIKPSASPAEINAVFTTAVPFDTVSYLYMRNNQLTLSETPPVWPLPSGNPNPDGTATNYQQSYTLDGMANCDGECGWPHPWDCPMESQGDGIDRVTWTPSSGWRNILGVVKFQQHVFGGGLYRCPC